MSPTIFRHGRYRGFFFSREEPRMHVHVDSPDGEAKFWIEPILALASHSGLSARELGRMQDAVEAHRDEIVQAWKGTSAASAPAVEILNVSPHGIWIFVAGEEHFLGYAEHPWFRDARIDEIFNVELTHGVHLRWPDLDVDLHLDSLRHPERFPLRSRER